MNIKMLFIALLTFVLMGCVQSAGVKYGEGPNYKSGPPPHAPAHGYRHKHKKHDMSYDSGLSAYVVLGLTDHYFDSGVYYRYRESGWQVSTSLSGHWEDTVPRAIPSKLYKSKMKDVKHHKKQHNKGKNKGKGKKKKGNDD